MKFLFGVFSITTMASLLLINNAWAGIDYIRYHEEFLGQQSRKKSYEDKKDRQPQSKPEQESKEQDATPSPQPKENHKPAKSSH